MTSGSLKARSILTILSIYLVVGAVTLLAFVWVARGISESFGRSFAEKNAQLDKERLVGPLRREVALARTLADSEAVRGLCEREEVPGAMAAGLAQLEGFRKVFADRSCFLVVDRSRHYYFGDAKAPARVPVHVLDPASLDDHWYFETLEKVDDFALHVDSDVALNLLKVWVNVVVKDGGRKVGLTGTGVDLSSFVKALVQDGDRNALTVMVDPKGVLQAHPNAQYMDFNARMKDESRRMTLYQLLGSEVDRTLLRERLDRLVRGVSTMETFHVTVEGKRYLAAGMYLKDLDWVTLTLVDQARIVGMRTFLPILALLGLSLLATIGLVSWLLNRTVLAPLARLTESSQEIAAGNYGITLEVAREDEFGRLTASFNHMAATIRDHTANLEGLVAERTRELTQSNRKLLDSLEYAHLIQESLLPKATELARHLADHFVLFRPRDIVGGDFYAILPDEQGCLLAVGDCTGHGVPGAFMSMSASAILSQLVAKLGPEDPALILRELNLALKALLHQGGRGPGAALDNGLDLGLLRVRPDRMVFAGARIPLWTLAPADADLQVHPAQNESLGYRRSRADFPFTNQVLALPQGTLCFLFTDGILDQHGGPFNYGLGRDRLARVLGEHRGLPMAGQGEALARALDEYRAGNPQRDDITILGFRSGPRDKE